MKYKPVIGLEVHVELKTKSKMFCSCSAEYFGHEPNTHTCPVCLGLPGALPVPNKKAIDWCVMIGLTLNCKINEESKFDRKNYFYPDLPKGYQISQYDQPFCTQGHIVLSTGKKITIRRVHMEEDTAKLIHQFEEDSSLIDFNRSGVPLVEIVTEPDFESALEVKEYLQKLQQIVRYLEVSDADMEKGEMRLEPNISLRSNTTNTTNNPISNKELPAYKVEVKNINSFKFVEKAINYELERQMKILEEGKTPSQETRGWDEKKQITVSQRSKEEAMDYRYFPEPDIPPIVFTQASIKKLAEDIPELPDKKFHRFKKDYGLSDYDAEILTRERQIAKYFDECIRVNQQLKNKNEKSAEIKQIANWIINKKVDIEQALPAQLIQQIISATQTSTIDETELEKIIKQVLSENPKAVEDYKKGKENVMMFLVGQVIQKTRQKTDSVLIRKILLKELK
ncbi:MAG: Asp-tRNA(Asn)/Glu-tRNA(Gln) amidotransferase subunit GatB [Candidatus Levybacteria bacterium]|nr:Asp-tRNA(Asn)/Glu-tRNA(Gln) amidotransferase subunit GatB [Candidatus Levybacteria bacterium]